MSLAGCSNELGHFPFLPLLGRFIGKKIMVMVKVITTFLKRETKTTFTDFEIEICKFRAYNLDRFRFINKALKNGFLRGAKMG